MPICVTPAAVERLGYLISKRPGAGVRLKLKAKGCSGLSYVMEYVDSPAEGDEVVVLNETITLFIQSRALLFLVGTEMDYQETPTQSGFVFKNPQEKGRCGCGSSFHV